MLLTEKEAREKGCCQPLAFEECNGGPVSCADKCIASKCMAWRWGAWLDDRERELYNKHTGKKVTGCHSIDSEWRLKNPKEKAPPKKGFCGLAGRVE